MTGSRILSHLTAGPSKWHEQAIPSTSSPSTAFCPVLRQQLPHNHLRPLFRVTRDKRCVQGIGYNPFSYGLRRISGFSSRMTELPDVGYLCTGRT